jgi:hypothetical protein
MSSVDFASLGISAPVLKAVKQLGYEQPSPVQAASIPIILEGNNQIIIATDGTFTGGSMSRKEIHRLIQLKTEEGIHLSTIGLNPNERGILFLNELAEIGRGNYIQMNGKEGEVSKLLEMVKLQSKKTP